MAKCSDLEESRSQECFEIRHAGEGKGFGIFATEDIEKGRQLNGKLYDQIDQSDEDINIVMILPKIIEIIVNEISEPIEQGPQLVRGLYCSCCFIFKSSCSLNSSFYDNPALEILLQFQNLDPVQQSEVLSLSNCRAESENDVTNTTTVDTLNGIFQTNCSFISSLNCYVLCTKFSRLNHSCYPNCSHVFDLVTKEKVVSASRNISRGEELTICYLNSSQDWFLGTSDRIHLLRTYYNFTCSCDVCTLPIPQMLQRDQQLNILQSYFDKLNSKVLSFETEENILLKASKTASNLDLAVHVVEYFDRLLFHLYCSTNDEKRAKIMASKCETHWKILHGESSFQSRKFRFHNLDPFSSFGEVETQFGQPILTELDQLLLCNILVRSNHVSRFCCECLEEVETNLVQCFECKIVCYCSEKCRKRHLTKHAKFCTLAAEFTTN